MKRSKKYREVEKNRYGLTSDEILFSRDTSLRQFVSLNRMAPYNEDGEYVPGWKKRRRFREMAKDEIDEEKEKHMPKASKGETETEEPKKKRRRQKKGKKNNPLMRKIKVGRRQLNRMLKQTSNQKLRDLERRRVKSSIKMSIVRQTRLKLVATQTLMFISQHKTSSLIKRRKRKNAKARRRRKKKKWMAFLHHVWHLMVSNNSY